MPVEANQIDQYSALKQQGMTKVYRDPLGETQFASRTFAPNGDKLRSTAPIDIADVERYRAGIVEAHEKRLASIDELIADLTAAKAAAQAAPD